MNWIRVAGILGFLGVGLGAFGAHALADHLETTGRVEVWKTAVFYHLVHSVVLLVIGRMKGRVAHWCFLSGIVVFSGSLYLLCLSDQSFWGAITPIGGLGLMAGWAWLLGKGRINLE